MTKVRQWGVLLGLLALVTAALAGLYLTGGARPPAPPTRGGTAASNGSSLVDQRPLQTARRLAALARTGGVRVVVCPICGCRFTVTADASF